jgi:multiple sugar transport system ATP-binding protein
MYDQPKNVFVAGFVGSPAMNLLTLRVEGDAVRFGDTDLRIPRDASEAVAGRTVVVGIRPEDMDLGQHGSGVELEVDVVEELGVDAYVYGSTKVGTETHPMVARVDGRRAPAKGDLINLVPRAGHIHLFDPDNGLRLAD